MGGEGEHEGCTGEVQEAGSRHPWAPTGLNFSHDLGDGLSAETQGTGPVTGKPVFVGAQRSHYPPAFTQLLNSGAGV